MTHQEVRAEFGIVKVGLDDAAQSAERGQRQRLCRSIVPIGAGTYEGSDQGRRSARRRASFFQTQPRSLGK